MTAVPKLGINVSTAETSGAIQNSECFRKRFIKSSLLRCNESPATFLKSDEMEAMGGARPPNPLQVGIHHRQGQKVAP